MRTMNRAGMELMQRLHIFRPYAVKNADGFLAIGYGHTQGVKDGDTVNEAEAFRLLQQDMGTYADYVRQIVTVPLTDNQFSALTAFCAHVSASIFQKSDLVRLLNRGWYDQVPAQLKKLGTKQPRIHKARRCAEAELWRTPDLEVQEDDVAA